MSTQTHGNAGASGQFKPADLVVPTTRMLAIGRLTEAGKSAARFPIMPSEVRETIRLHLTGKIDQWFFQTEGGGVVFIMNVTERAEAYELNASDIALGGECPGVTPNAAGLVRC
jgi:hypothetical protein